MSVDSWIDFGVDNWFLMKSDGSIPSVLLYAAMDVYSDIRERTPDVVGADAEADDVGAVPPSLLPPWRFLEEAGRRTLSPVSASLVESRSIDAAYRLETNGISKSNQKGNQH